MHLLVCRLCGPGLNKYPQHRAVDITGLGVHGVKTWDVWLCAMHAAVPLR